MPSRGRFIAILAASERERRFRARSGQNKRLPLLLRDSPAVRSAQERARGPSEAEVQSAFELTKAAHRSIQRLEKRTGKVRAQVSVDRELIGGVKVVLGDKFIDGSARAQLGALETR